MLEGVLADAYFFVLQSKGVVALVGGRFVSAQAARWCQSGALNPGLSTPPGGVVTCGIKRELRPGGSDPSSPPSG